MPALAFEHHPALVVAVEHIEPVAVDDAGVAVAAVVVELEPLDAASTFAVADGTVAGHVAAVDGVFDFVVAAGYAVAVVAAAY